MNKNLSRNVAFGFGLPLRFTGFWSLHEYQWLVMLRSTSLRELRFFLDSKSQDVDLQGKPMHGQDQLIHTNKRQPSVLGYPFGLQGFGAKPSTR